MHPRARKGRAPAKNFGVDLYSTAGIRSAIFHNISLIASVAPLATLSVTRAPRLTWSWLYPTIGEDYLDLDCEGYGGPDACG